MYELTYYYYQPNIKTNIAIQGGKPSEEKNVLYPAESTKHKHEISSIIASKDTDQTQDAIRTVVSYHNTSIIMIVALKKISRFQF